MNKIKRKDKKSITHSPDLNNKSVRSDRNSIKSNVEEKVKIFYINYIKILIKVQNLGI